MMRSSFLQSPIVRGFSGFVFGIVSLACVASAAEIVSWELDAASVSADVRSDWQIGGDKSLPPPGVTQVSVNGQSTPVILFPNVQGSSRSLNLRFPGLGGNGPSPRLVRLEIEIGVGQGGGSGLYWLIKRGDFDLRGDRNGVHLAGADKNRVRIGQGADAGKLSHIELIYNPVTRQVTAARVDGVQAAGFSPVETEGLAGSTSRLRIFAPTPSGKPIWIKRIAIRRAADDAAAGGAPSASASPRIDSQARWMKPAPAESPRQPQKPLPTWTPLAGADSLTFAIDSGRLANPPFSGEVLLTRAGFGHLPDTLAGDPLAASYWRVSENFARRLLADGNWSHWVSNPNQYTYTVRGFLPRLALLHAATGQKDLGRLVRLLILDLAERPATFWIHDDLRAYDPDFTIGQLETAELARGLSISFQWAQDLFNDQEKAAIRFAIQNKGLDPSLRWLANPKSHNNFMAVIGGGSLVAAKVLGDEAAAQLATQRMEEWLGLIETDGSYGEPVGYFDYGAAAFFYGWWALGRDEGSRLLRQHEALRGTLSWMAAHYAIADKPEDGRRIRRVNFGDDDIFKGATPMTSESLAYAFDDGVGTWLRDRVGKRELNTYEFLFHLVSQEKPLPDARPPSGPTAKVYAVGPAILRSGWTMDRDIVLALRGAGAARTGYSHDRGNRNAFMLFVDGEIFFAAPGRASYRSPLANAWDRRTGSHSTVTLNGQNQLRDRVARYTHFSDDGNLVEVASEAAGAYADAPKSVLRRMWLDREAGVIAIEDTILPSRPSAIAWHLLLANYDGKTRLTQSGALDSGWRFQRPGGEVKFWIQADRPLKFTNTEGIMHTGYSYAPGGENEGKPGSAIRLTWEPGAGASDALRVWTFILTRGQEAADATAALVSHDEHALVWRLTRNGQTSRRIFPISPDNQ